MAENLDDFLNRAFLAARDIGYVLVGRQAPCTFHRRGDRRPDRPGAEDGLSRAVEELRAGLGLLGNTPEDLVKSLSMLGGLTWERDALAKIIRSLALVQKRDKEADRLALSLLGQAVWAKQEHQPDVAWEREIKEVWPTRLTT